MGGPTDRRWNQLPASNQPSDNQGQHGPLPAIPTQLGHTLAIKHVFLIIKENRTYDNVLGDIAKGNGDPADTVFGAEETPNEHSLANTFRSVRQLSTTRACSRMMATIGSTKATTHDYME